MAVSREKEGVFGDKYTEHTDDAGKKIGESRERESILGDDYVEHRDKESHKTGESREREGLLGDKYTEHRDSDFNKIGESREREGIFGDKYTEHLDNEGNIIGESRGREGVLGDTYVEHTGQAPHHIPGEDEDSVDIDNLWDKIQDKAFFIGAAIGAIIGLSSAFESATDITGYLIYTGIGAVAGGVLGILLVKMLPWGIALGAVILILKACGVEI